MHLPELEVRAFQISSAQEVLGDIVACLGSCRLPVQGYRLLLLV